MQQNTFLNAEYQIAITYDYRSLMLISILKRSTIQITLIMKEKKNKRCPICGCTEHRLIGCATHWRNHVKNDEARCKIRKDEESI
jgi:hypothetical protein